MKVCVTGGTGYLGTHIAGELVSSGYEVTLLVRGGRKGREGMPANIAVVEGDITEPSSLVNAFAGKDGVFHAASVVKSWVPDRRLFDNVNIRGFRNVLDACLRCGVRRIAHTSTFLALGPTDGVPEADEKTVLESRHFHNDYERTKTAQEAILGEYVQKGLHGVILNPTVVFGPGRLTDGNLVAGIILKFMNGKIPGLFGKGDKVWNYAFARDVARGHVLAFEKGRSGERYILGGENLSMRQFLDALSLRTGKGYPKRELPYSLLETVGVLEQSIARLTGRKPSLTRAEASIYRHNWSYTSRKAETELGYRKTPFSDALDETIAWAKSLRKGQGQES